MEENDINHITKALKMSKGKLARPGGAAELFNLPFSTLVSKIRKPGINKNSMKKYLSFNRFGKNTLLPGYGSKPFVCGAYPKLRFIKP
jgi:hypothetical protein